jgi:vacuolar-type H+-ATPase subunit H
METDKRFDQAKMETDKRFDQAKMEADKRFEQIERKLDQQHTEIMAIHHEIRLQMRWVFGLVLSVAGLVIAVSRLH